MRADVPLLEHIAYNVRRSILVQTSYAGSGHPTSALSATDVVTTLFFYVMQFDLQDHKNSSNDRFVLSKGHASPVLYAVYKELGILTDQDLLTYRQFDSVLEGHPTPRFVWSEAATGSLGQGISIAVGIALIAQRDKSDSKTYVLIGDSEMSEGSVWEALEIASYYKLHNLIGIIDCNRLGQTGQTMFGYDTEKYVSKAEAFGWRAYVVDGHNVKDLMKLFDTIKAEQCNRPTMIIAKTMKGYGVTDAENKNGFHGKAFTKQELPQLLNEMEQRFPVAAHYVPATVNKEPINVQETFTATAHKQVSKNGQVDHAPYQVGDEVMTRKAFGQALVHFGVSYQDIVVFDAEVKNSTYTDLFEERFPERFVQSFVAEQNMVAMAVGAYNKGKIPFCATFGAFFTRAFDQIRMASVGNCPLRLVGSHAGVSIGEDGPSQMALEDIAMMRAVHNSVVLYPSDGVAAWKLVHEMIQYESGITYLRTTRMATPILYSSTEQFVIGGSKLVYQSTNDQAVVVAAGITLHEAIKAYHVLLKDNIHIAVIDLYSIKPLDAATVQRVAQQAGNKLITVEDHYLEGGLGQAVAYALKDTDIEITCLAVNKMPRSGRPEQLMQYEQIDANAIVLAVKRTTT